MSLRFVAQTQGQTDAQWQELVLKASVAGMGDSLKGVNLVIQCSGKNHLQFDTLVHGQAGKRTCFKQNS